MPEAVVVAAARTPIGRAVKGALRDERPDDMAAQVIGQALAQVPQVEAEPIDDLLLGCGSPGGEQGFNMARVVAVLLGRDDVPGVTLTRYCASSLQTTRMALHAIRAGEGEMYVSAGVESISSYGRGEADSWPGTENQAFAEARRRTEHQARCGASWRDPREQGLLPDVYVGMGETAENVADVAQVTREEMDAYALTSQRRVAAAAEEGFWDIDITPYTRRDGSTIDRDDSPRPGTTLEGLAQLPAAFRPEGRVTAGNSCPLNDGAAALVLMSDKRARELEIQPLARVVATAVSALSPEVMGLGPVDAVRHALDRAGLATGDIDQFEVNEAFAAQVLPVARELAIPEDRLNVNGGAIALGHPFGSTGARITCTLINSLRARDDHFGVVSMCVAGGMGMAVVLERMS